MSDLINREELIDWLTSRIIMLKGIYGDLGGAVSGVREMVKVMPSVEPERKKGYWTEDSDPGQIIGEHYSCSECRACFGTFKPNFCPNCGADMRGE